MTFALLTCRVNSLLLIKNIGKLKFRNDMANNAIRGMAKASVPIYEGGARAGEHTWWCSRRGESMIESISTQAVVEDFLGDTILKKKNKMGEIPHKHCYQK